MSVEFPGLQKVIDRMLWGRGEIKVLEAGCGSTSHLCFNREVYLVGIDISEEQLQQNVVLNKRILGDVQYYDFPPFSFDIIVCWDVLEHLPKPELALYKFAKALKEGGLIVLRLPNVFSLKGLLTKYLPYSLHRVAYRYLQGNAPPGIKYLGPFRTFLRFSISPEGIKEFAFKNGMRVVFFGTYDVLNASWFKRNRFAYNVYKILRTLTAFISFHKLGDSDYAVILQKQ